MKPGVYIHIPFCEQRCYYCAFTVVVAREDTYVPYVDRVIHEIALSEWTEAPETVFLGGGTPSIVSGESVARLIGALPSGASEISIEANPGTFDRCKIAAWKDAGVNRVSLGVQSFHDDDLAAAGRIHKASDVFEDFASLRREGFANINLDLIAGLPDQRLALWQSNLEWIARLAPEHVSIYMLELEERSPWSRKKPETHADEEFLRFYGEACDRLEAAGYVHYEISNWSLPGFECLHNLKYWSGAPYRGFGVGAHSFDRRRRFWNTSGLAEFAARIDAQELPVSGSEILTRDMRIEEAFMLGLRRTSGFDVRAVAQELEIQYSPAWLARALQLQEAGLIEFDGTNLKLTRAGWTVATGVTEELLWPTLLSTSAATP